MPKLKSKHKNIVIFSIASVISISILGGIISIFLKPAVPVSSESSSKKKLQISSLTIGILGDPSKYNSLANYLRSQFDNKVQVTIDGGGFIPYEKVKNRLMRKEWDIAFTLSPMLSVVAKENGYTFAAQMFPDKPPYYQAALFVKSNSSIQSLNDLKAKTTIALGGFNSASSFYMPAYDLFGRTLNVDMGHRSQKIVAMVKTGEADVGAVAYDNVKDDKTFRVIHISRSIPGSSVYLSPNLSDLDRETLKKVILDAPVDIKHQANYDAGPEPDYSYFIKISQRAEEVLRCADFKHNPVDFYCSHGSTKTSHLSESKTIEGRINGWSRKDSNTDQFNLSGTDNKIYLVYIPRKILNQVLGASNPLALQAKNIRVVSVTPREVSKGNFELKITQPNQLVVL